MHITAITVLYRQRHLSSLVLLGISVILLASCLLLTANPAHADNLSSTLEEQEAQRARERERQLREQQEGSADVRLPRAETETERLPAEETPCFVINHIELLDETHKLAWAREAADLPDDVATGRCLGSQGINLVMTRIQNALIAQGYVTTRVLAETQDLSRGTLTLKILPGRVREIRFTEDTSPRATLWNAFPISSGDLLNLRDIEQGLENLKRLPTTEADIQIVPTDTVGESDIVVTWKQTFPFRITLNANDGGSKSTGKYQGNATLTGEHLFALNDMLYYSYGHDLGGADKSRSGTMSHTWHYSVPYGNWLAAFTASDYTYRQAVAGITQTYIYQGKQDNKELKLTRLLYRDTTQKLHLWLRGYLANMRNYIDNTEIEIQRRRMAGWELGTTYRLYPQILPGAVLDASFAYRKGTGMLNAMPAPEEHFGEGTSRPKIWTTEINLAVPFQALNQRFFYNADFRGQWNDTPLVPTDRFSIGGRYTVRGFDGETILSAERGWLIRNDLALALGDTGQQAYIGLDHGEVGGQTAKLLLGRRLTGGVLGLRGGYKAFFYDVFIGKALDAPKYFPTRNALTGFNLTFSY
ncbi:MAG: ShlB/FhaC/HecB family hemolysin secretion/activation protein [Methylobacillus sp.]|nr:ShlB/FhaC/HecB family hemolysin secretion/activation protein [Methylobacillus sp.]